MAKRAVLFGASGIVGNYLSRHLAAEGWEVLSLMKTERDVGGKVCEFVLC